MAVRLAGLADAADPVNEFFSIPRVARARELLANASDQRTVMWLLPEYARDLIRAGYPREALDELDRLGRLRAQLGGEFTEPFDLDLERVTAYLRLAEQENCIAHHSSESCLVPLKGSGLHSARTGSQAARRLLLQVLRQGRGGPAEVWLLNVASMTLGEYPEGVPSQWRIPPSAFRSDYDIKRFPEVATGAGLAVNALSGGSVIEDFDGDGLLDVMSSSVQRGTMALFRNNGDGSFTDRTQAAGLEGEIAGSNLAAGDFNNDGRQDVLVLRGGWLGEQGRLPVSLLRNRGDGTFENVTEAAGLLRFRPCQTAVWFDYDGDGWLDLFIGNETSAGSSFPCELYRNNANGTFTECASANGIRVSAFVKGAVSGDYNNDGRPDLYLSVLGDRNRLYRNDGPTATGWKFTELAASAGVEEPIACFPAFFFDYNNDGWEDLFVCAYDSRQSALAEVASEYLGNPTRGMKSCLYRNNGNGTFTNVAPALGFNHVLYGMGINFGDLDNDGWLDFYVGTGTLDIRAIMPNRMFRNAEGKRFQDVTTSGGFGHLQKGHGISFADLDNDGDQEVHVDLGGGFPGDLAFNALFRNPGHGNHWLKLSLEGVKSNRSAYGARITVSLRTPGGARKIYRTVGVGGSFGCNPLRQEIGCGRATAIESVEVFWPASGLRQTFEGLELDRAYRLREADPLARPVALKSFRLPDALAPARR